MKVYRLCFISIIITNVLMAQTKDSIRNYSFAVSNSVKGNVVYISTLFCWSCTPSHPCNGVLYGKDNSPCEFLAKWSLSVFKKQKDFNGKEATVSCLTESLTMYNYGSEQEMEKHRNEVIDNYRNKLHKTVVVVSFPRCIE